MAHGSEVAPRPVVYVLSSLTYPPLEGQHANHVLLLRAMRAAGHEVALVALARRPEALDAVALAAAVGGLAEVTVIPTRLNYPLMLLQQLVLGAWLGGAPLARALRRLQARWPDAVLHLEGIGLVPLVARLGQHAVLVTTTDAWSLRQRRLAALGTTWWRRWFLRGYAAVSAWVERRYFPQAGAVQVVSPVDAQYLRDTVPGARVECIPIALTTLPADASPTAPEQAADTALPTVLFWGDIRVPHLAQGLRWMLSQVRPHVTQPAQWVVLGRSAPTAELRALAPEVRYLEWVDDVDALLRSAAVVVLPDAQGTGLKNRAIHAMACSVPVVGTPAAFEGFEVTDEDQAMVKAEAAAFADSVQRLLTQPAKAAQMAREGRQFAHEGYAIDAVARRWNALYAGLAPRGRQAR